MNCWTINMHGIRDSRKSESYNMILKSKPNQSACWILNAVLSQFSIQVSTCIASSCFRFSGGGLERAAAKTTKTSLEIRASHRKVKKAGKNRGWWDNSRQLASKNMTWARCTRPYEERRESACSSCSLTSSRVPTQEHLYTLSLTLIYTLTNTHTYTHAQLINF